MKAIYKFEENCGRHGMLQGIFVAEEDDIKKSIGKTVVFGEVLGKHSDVTVELTEDHFDKVTDDPTAVRIFLSYDLSCGYCPFDFRILEDEKECEG